MTACDHLHSTCSRRGFAGDPCVAPKQCAHSWTSYSASTMGFPMLRRSQSASSCVRARHFHRLPPSRAVKFPPRPVVEGLAERSRLPRSYPGTGPLRLIGRVHPTVAGVRSRRRQSTSLGFSSWARCIITRPRDSKKACRCEDLQSHAATWRCGSCSSFPQRGGQCPAPTLKPALAKPRRHVGHR